MEEKIYYLGLVFNFEPPNSKVLKLYKKYKSFKKIFQELEKEFKKNLDWEKEYEKLQKFGGDLILISDKEFPKELKEIKTYVLGIFVLGEKNLNKFKNKIAVVGTRKPSKIGEKTAKEFSKTFAENDLTIISGLAYGIDLASHLGALEAKKETFAVIGCGLDIILKEPRKKYVEKIIEFGGGIISEYPLGSPQKPHHFPLRNRIIAALGKILIIIEAPENSGSLITAKFALEYGKDIYALPGSIYDKNYRGNLKLIQEGAYLLLSPEEILNIFGKKQKKRDFNLSLEEKLIVKHLTGSSKTIDELKKLTGLEIGKLLEILTSLEIKEIITNKEGRIYLNEAFNS